MEKTFNRTFDSRFQKAIKKASKNAQTLIEKGIISILENPLTGEILKGNLRGLKKYRIYGTPEYRIIYAVYSCEETPVCRFEICETPEEKELCFGVIDFIAVGSREETDHFYSKPRKEIERMLREINR